MQLSTPLAALVAVAVTFGGGYVLLQWKSASDLAAREEARREQSARREEREAALRAQVEAQMAPVREASAPLIPEPLAGTQLGMTREALLALRDVRPRQDGDRPTMSFYEERLESGAQVVYGVDDDLDVLTQVQVMSAIPPRAVAPHLEAMHARYGTPTGIWNCPASGAAGLPMRRFTWRAGAAAVQDILLVHPNGVSQTLYIGTSETIGASLRISHCQPVRSREELDALPFASPEAFQRAVEENGRGVVF